MSTLHNTVYARIEKPTILPNGSIAAASGTTTTTTSPMKGTKGASQTAHIAGAQVTLPDTQSLPRTFGHNWDDPAFAKTHDRPQVLQQEWQGKILPAKGNPSSSQQNSTQGSTHAASTLKLQANLIAKAMASHGGATAAALASTLGSNLDAGAFDGPQHDDTEDQKVMRFYAFFVQDIKESALERKRVRKVVIKAFPFDDTVLIEEPKVANSGLQGGVILKRQRIPLMDSYGYLSVSDGTFNVGTIVVIFGTEYHLYACDRFTRESLLPQLLNIPVEDVPMDGPEPDDYYQLQRERSSPNRRQQDRSYSFENRDLKITAESLGAKGKPITCRFPDEVARCKKFYDQGGQVCRFYAYWYDTEATQLGAPGEPVTVNLPAMDGTQKSSLSGTNDLAKMTALSNNQGKSLNNNATGLGRVRIFDVLCYVEDSTVSITERRMDGTPGVSIPRHFLSRCRLPISGSSSKAVELTFASRINGQPEAAIGPKDRYYEVEDFRIGQPLNIFGREFILYDCDAFTRDFYGSSGIPQAESIDISTYYPKKLERKLLIPPHMGYGTDADSMASCGSLMLKAPKKEPAGVTHAVASAKVDPLNPNATLSSDVVEGQNVRFEMKLVEGSDGGVSYGNIDAAPRAFTLSFFLDDGQMMITEAAVRNTGFTGGKFLRKQKLPRLTPPPSTKNGGVPFSEMRGIGGPKFYGLEDLVVGNRLTVNGFVFELLRTDAHSAQLLQFSRSAIQLPLLEPSELGLEDGSNGIRSGASSNAPVTGAEAQRSRELLKALKDFITVRFVTLTEAFRAFDHNKDGYVTLQELQKALSAYQLSKKPEEGEALMVLMDLERIGKLSYAGFVNGLQQSFGGNAAAVPAPPNPLLGGAPKSPPRAGMLKSTSTSQNGLQETSSSAGGEGPSPNEIIADANTKSALQSLQRKTLKTLNQKLESRCMTIAEMFRLFAVLPRESINYRAVNQQKQQGARGGVGSGLSASSLANGAKDTIMTGSQMRRGIQDILGLMFSESEMYATLTFFFEPLLKPEQIGTLAETVASTGIPLSTFMEKMVQIHKLVQIN